MNKPISIILAIVSLVVLTIRISRCSGNMSKKAHYKAIGKYHAACQEKIDSAWYYFKPVLRAAAMNENVAEQDLARATTKLYDLATEARVIEAYDDEGGYIKKYAADFIEHQRSFTCCYIKKYQEEIAKDKKIKKGTSHNLIQWIERYKSWNSSYGAAFFDLNNNTDLSILQEAVIKATPAD